MKMIYFQDHRASRYHELSEDTPARRDDKMFLLKDAPQDGGDIEVFLAGDWSFGWLPGTPTTFLFQVECISFEDERTVQGVIHEGLIKHPGARGSKLTGFKITPPSKQCAILPDETYVVIAREDRQPDGSPGRYTLATRATFKSEEAALSYAAGISSSREPLVVPGRFGELRAE